MKNINLIDNESNEYAKSILSKYYQSNIIPAEKK